MAQRTVEIDEDTYERLRQIQRPNEPLGETIRRIVPPGAFDAERFLRAVDQLSDAAVDAIEERLSDRSRPSDRER